MIDNIYMIVAMTKNTRAIGIDGDMLYHLKDDLRYFKETTLNHTIVCGRKTLVFQKDPFQIGRISYLLGGITITTRPILFTLRKMLFNMPLTTQMKRYLYVVVTMSINSLWILPVGSI